MEKVEKVINRELLLMKLGRNVFYYIKFKPLISEWASRQLMNLALTVYWWFFSYINPCLTTNCNCHDFGRSVDPQLANTSTGMLLKQGLHVLLSGFY